MFNLNAKGPLFAVQKFAPLINRGGSVVLTTSIANVKGMAGNATYGAAGRKRRTREMHNLVVSCLAVAYLAANVYAIVKVRVFELARSRKHLILYGVPFTLWALSSFWNVGSWRSCADSMNAPAN